MAHKKFIDNPLGVRLSKKESLLIPLQKQKAGGSARFLCDLCDSSSRGYTGKGLSPPLQASGSASSPACLLEPPFWLVWTSLFKPASAVSLGKAPLV